MRTSPPSSASPWLAWLTAVALGVAMCGLVLVVAPGLAGRGFSLLIYGRVDRIASFGAEATRYIALAHAVIGSLMLGWGIALVIVVRRLVARGSALGWKIVAFSMAAWWAADSAFSLATGAWPNAVLNTLVLALFAVPLAALRRACGVGVAADEGAAR